MTRGAAEPFRFVPIDAVERYWDNFPCNISDSDEPIGSREYFDEVEARKYFFEPHIPSFAQFARWRGKKVLEIGCGIGTDTISFARAGASVTAVDLSARSLSVARQRALVFGLEERINFFQADAEHLTKVVPIDAYDLIYSFGVIHHTPHPERVIEQLRAYADKATVFKIMVYNRLSWKVLLMLRNERKGPFWRLDNIVANSSESQAGCPVAYTYAKSGVRKLLQGLRITDARVDHIFPYQVADYATRRFVKFWYFRYLPSPVFRVLERLLGWHHCVTARLNTQASPTPARSACSGKTPQT